jgi:hypothetical protein
MLHVLLLCRDFVTGFRKRKQQRRKDANSQLEKKAKKQRVEQRAEVGSAGVVAIKYAVGVATVLASSWNAAVSQPSCIHSSCSSSGHHLQAAHNAQQQCCKRTALRSHNAQHSRP